MENKNWEKFLFPSVFKIEKGFYNKKPSSKYNDNDIPFLGATAFNNGVSDFYNIRDIEEASKVGYGNNEDLDKKIFTENSIVVTNNGSVGHAYFHKTKFTCSHDVNPLYLKNKILNKNSAIFLITCIEKQKVCFEYARKWRPKRMVKSSLLLPVGTNNSPDYEYMEQYSRSIFKRKEKEYLDYIKERLNELKTASKPIPLEEKEWSSFSIDDLFDINIGKNIDGNKIDKENGRTPYVTRKESNNGLDGFIDFEDVFLNKIYPVLTIGNETSEPFVQNFMFYTGTKVNIMKPKTKLNRYSLSFISTSLKKHKSKYSYSYTINSTRLKKQRVFLPINSNGSPDYEYMEQYMKYNEYQKLKEYIDFKNKT